MSAANRILLIDDDEDDREIFVEVVSDLDGSAVLTTAINGADGFAKIAATDQLPNIIFLDLNMPVMNGTEFLRKIKAEEKLRNIPVVILTTSSDEWVVREARALGAGAVISKPTRFKDWRTALRDFVPGKG